MTRVLFIEPFYGGSHRAFLDGLVAHSEHTFELLTLPEGEWRRRMRLGAQELAPRAATLDGSFDLLVTSDMLDLPAFLALTRRRFADLPVLLYLHENQLTYPRIRGTKLNSWFGAINYLSAAVADIVAFNSAFHRDDFLGALRTLGREPQNWIVPATVDAIEAKSVVLPVGVDLARLDVAEAPARDRALPPLLLWNHRWEFDKAPDVFARALLRLAQEGVPFGVAIAGEPGSNPHPALAELRAGLGPRVTHFGPLDRSAYERLLAAADIVVSTTRHEFFGVGMVEALYSGCFPIVPARYNYPALVPANLHGDALWHDEDDLLVKLRAACLNPATTDVRRELRASAARFDWGRVAGSWDAAIATAARGPDREGR